MEGLGIMSNIFNFEDYKNTTNNSAIEKMITEFLELPDDIFEEAWPAIKEELIKTTKTKEFEKEVKDSFPQNISIASTKEGILKAIEYFKSPEVTENLIQSKIDFLNFLLYTTLDVIEGVPYREKVEIYIEKCHENAKIPSYANPTDAGCDVYAVEHTTINPGETKIIPTGLKVAVPAGWMLSVRPRSGMSAKTNIRVANAPGTIDAGYRNEVGIILHNTGTTAYEINIGDRIAQFVIEVSPMIKFVSVDDINSIEGNRGGGFGSTGK